MKKHKKEMIVEELSHDSDLVCDYGCGKKAKFLLGVKNVLVAQVNFNFVVS